MQIGPYNTNDNTPVDFNVFPIIPFISGIELFMYVISHWFGVFSNK